VTGNHSTQTQKGMFDMGQELEYLPEQVVSAPGSDPGNSEAAMHTRLRLLEAENAKKDEIMRRHGIPTQPVPVVPAAPVVPLVAPASGAGVDPRAVAHEVTGAVHNEIDGLRLEMSELIRGQADILKQLQHAGGFSVSEQGNRVDKVEPPTVASGVKPDAPANNATGTPGTNPSSFEDQEVYVSGIHLPGGRRKNGPYKKMTVAEAEAGGYRYSRNPPKKLAL